MRPSSNALRAASLGIALALLAGCSEYLDRRDMISPYGGDAVQTNKVVQMIDPWPRASANRNIAYNGASMQMAVERYRTGNVIPPKGIGTSGTYQSQNSQQNNTTPVGPTVTQPAAQVK